MNRVDMAELVSHSYDSAKNTIESGGSEAQHWMLMNDEGELCMIMAPWEAGDHRGRDMCIMFARLQALLHRATRLVFVSEVWVSKQAPNGPRMEPRLDPDREEALMIVAAGPEGMSHATAFITRTDGVPTVGALTPIDGIIEDNVASTVLPPQRILDVLNDNDLKGLREVISEFQRRGLAQEVSDRGSIH